VLNTSPDSRLISLSASVYRALLALYPAQFKQEYAPHMAQVFRDCCRRAYHEGGIPSLLLLWARTTLDYLKTIVEEYARGGTYMTREKFIKLSGWAMVLGSAVTIIGWLADTRPQYSQYNAASLPIDRYANLVAMPIIVIGTFLLSLGMLGLLVRYGRIAGGFGRSILALGALSGVVSAMGIAGLTGDDSNLSWGMFYFGMTIQYLMLALFGIVCIKQRILPRWNGLPLLAGLWVPGYVLLSGFLELYTGTWLDTPEAVFYSIWLITLVGFAGLGYLLQSDAQPSNPAAV
jgi:hypothetical protein